MQQELSPRNSDKHLFSIQEAKPHTTFQLMIITTILHLSRHTPNLPLILTPSHLPQPPTNRISSFSPLITRHTSSTNSNWPSNLCGITLTQRLSSTSASHSNRCNHCGNLIRPHLTNKTTISIKSTSSPKKAMLNFQPIYSRPRMGVVREKIARKAR